MPLAPLLAIAFSLATGATVQFDVQPATPCVSAESLSARLSKLGLVLARPGDLEVQIFGSADQIQVRGRTRSGATFERAVPATAEDCDAVERVVAALVRAWAGSELLTSVAPPVVVLAPVPVAPRPPTPAPPQPVPTPTPPKPVEPTATVPQVASEVIVPRPSTPPREWPATGTGPGLLSPEMERRVAETRPSIGPSAAQPTASPLRARLSLRAGVAGGPSNSAVPLGSASLHLGVRWIGVEVEGGFAGALQQGVGPGQVYASMQWLTLSARLDVPVYTRVTLEALLGLRGTRIAAGSTGLDTSKQIELFALGAYVAGGLDVRLAGPLSVVFRGVFTLRFPEEHLVVDGVGDTLTLRVWQLGAEAGLAVWFP